MNMSSIYDRTDKNKFRCFVELLSLLQTMPSNNGDITKTIRLQCIKWPFVFQSTFFCCRFVSMTHSSILSLIIVSLMLFCLTTMRRFIRHCLTFWRHLLRLSFSILPVSSLCPFPALDDELVWCANLRLCFVSVFVPGMIAGQDLQMPDIWNVFCLSRKPFQIFFMHNSTKSKKVIPTIANR